MPQALLTILAVWLFAAPVSFASAAEGDIPADQSVTTDTTTTDSHEITISISGDGTIALITGDGTVQLPEDSTGDEDAPVCPTFPPALFDAATGFLVVPNVVVKGAGGIEVGLSRVIFVLAGNGFVPVWWEQ